MRILIISDYLAEGARGGSDRILYEHSKRLKKKYHAVKIIASGPRRNSGRDIFASEGIEVVRNKVDDNRFLRLFQTFFGTRSAFKNLAKTEKFDAIMFHQPLSASSALLGRTGESIRKVYIYHSPWHREYEIERAPSPFLYKVNSIMRKMVERFCVDRCDKIIVLSEYMKNELIKTHGVAEAKVSVIPGGVDTEIFKPPASKKEVRNRLSFPGDKTILLVVKGLVKRGGVIELVRAVGPLFKKRDDLMLVIASDGPRRADVEALIEEFGLASRIRVTGFVDEEVLLSYYQAADIFIMPSRELEGFGLVMLEALSAGLPVLATPVSAIPEVLSGMDKRCVFEELRPESLRKGIEEFTSDRELMRSVGESARKYVLGRYSWEHILPRLERELMKEIKDQAVE